MVILFTPRHLSSYNATFTLSAKNKNDKFSILQHEFHLDQVELIYFSKHTKAGDKTATATELHLTGSGTSGSKQNRGVFD